MKGMLGWIKSNLATVVLLVLTLAIPPTCWFLSSGWNKSIQSHAQTEGKKKYDQMNGLKVTYVVDPTSPGAEPVTLTTEPNPVLTDAFLAQRQAVKDDAIRVVELVRAFNRRKHQVLVDGLFPEPLPNQAQTKAIDFVKKIVPSGDESRLSAFEQMLADYGCGGPPDAEEMATALQSMSDQEYERYDALGTKPTPEQETEIVEKLTSRRVGEYQRRSQQFSIYATPEILPLNVPRELPTQPPAVDECFEWQWDFWVIEDMLSVMREANLGPDGNPTTVDQATVKRVVSIEVSPLPGTRLARGNTGRRNSPEDDAWANYVPEYERMNQPQERGGRSSSSASSQPDGEVGPYTAPTEIIARKPAVSLTGWDSGPSATDNQLYDVRTVTMQIIASSARLPRLFDAMRATNIMDVRDMDLSDVDVWGDLAQGYYYGDEHVVNVYVEVDTIWLRDWTRDLMPEAIRERLGVAMPATEAETESDLNEPF